MQEPSVIEPAESPELSQSLLDNIQTDTGESMQAPGAIADAEALMQPREKNRARSFNMGHKLRITQELARGMTQAQVCKKHRISKSALALILADDTLAEVVNPSYIGETKKLMANRFYQLADMALSHIDAAKLAHLDPYKLGILASVALDKARLIEGQSTENLSFRSLAVNIRGTLDQLKERKAHLMAIIQGRSGMLPAQAPITVEDSNSVEPCLPLG